MNLVLLDDFTSVMSAKNKEALRRKVVAFTKRLGFDTVTAMAVIERANEKPEFVVIDNAPAAYRELHSSTDGGRCDPVMQHCKRNSVLIIWNQGTYTGAGKGEKWEVHASHGYGAGIALATHLPGGRHFFLGIDRDQALPPSAAEITRLVAELNLFAVLGQDLVLRILLGESRAEVDIPSLTARELECLRWAMEGKTAWELGRILGISEQTAVRHLNNATHKLDCTNKHHAVVKAMRFGLIG